ncbi:Spore maturation protein SpmB [Succinivibrio dextrinosolvens]|uniref:nucleoside recognition domain-containing protein n=1 Tax=Succinivibrio dextrinosolvens TaxID=83771 RepID=UPI0008F3879B|nr:nucleoside recognition domain-containing protein [Succinivibrio dextrinosolvens]SFS83568.1 Spore maturation protein SpmB [Succinivibrio dextrinosolvens]
MFNFRVITKNAMEYISLVMVIAFFSGVCAKGPEWLSAFDYSTILGKFGTIAGTSDNFTGKGDISVRSAFLFALSIIPGIILSLGVLSVAGYLGALNAAGRIFSFILKPLLGLPGSSAFAIISSLQSSDSGAVMTKDLYDQRIISKKQRCIFSAFEFSSGGSIGVYLTAMPIISAHLNLPILLPLGIILIMKIVGANLIRAYLCVRKNEEDESLSGEEKSSDNSLKKQNSENISNIADAFISGAKRAINISLNIMMPNVIMAFVLTAVLMKIGAMDFLGKIGSPLMQIFDLNGQSMVVLVSAWFSGLGGVAMGATMCASGEITQNQLAIITPAIFLMGAQLQYMGRILGVIGLEFRNYRLMFAISIINAVLSILVMKAII